MSDNTPEEILDSVAQKIVKLRFEAPALFFLEAHIPFLSIVHTLELFVEPIATPFFGAEKMHKLRVLLSDRKYIELLIEKISNYVALRDSKQVQGA